MSETFWTAVGAIGGTLAFGGVIWQAQLTRRTLQVSELVAADAIRSRLDSQAPDVLLSMEPPPWPPLAWTPSGMPCNPWPNGHTWHFPRDQEGANQLVPQQLLTLENRSGRRLQVRFEGDLFTVEDRRPAEPGVMLLEVDETTPPVYLQRSFTIKELSENYRAREAGRELPHQVRGSITVEDDRDNGSSDRWDLVLTGCPVEPVPDQDGLWRIALPHFTEGSGRRSLDYSLLPPRQRVHWISRAQDVRLPAPAGAPTHT
ncbi:hypothetical protein ACFC0K_37825 [Streptomyces hydrogenans]|uniref:hypothetical protein n=1 Tax=Streptomyces hydrogenans TaxID=1873719 RepID=UPI0035DF8E66